jgi:hypothetical protein
MKIERVKFLATPGFEIRLQPPGGIRKART